MKVSEKRLFRVAAASVAVLLGGGLWWNHVNSDAIIPMPPRQLPVPNAFDYYAKAGTSLRALIAATPGAKSVDAVTDSSAGVGLTPTQLAERYPTAAKRAWVKKCAPVLQALRQGFDHSYVDTTPLKLDSLYPHFAQYRELARLLAIEAHVSAESGDWASASRSALDILRIGYDTPRGSIMMGALVGSSINSMARRELSAVIPHLDARSARVASASIEALEATRVPFGDVLLQDKYFGQLFLQDKMRQKNWRVPGRPTDITDDDEINFGDSARQLLSSKQGILNNQARHMDALIAQMRRPYLLRERPELPLDPLNQDLLAVYQRADWNPTRDATGNCVLMLQLALRSYFLEHGAYPDSLDQLTPAYIKKVPPDPFGAGEALRYRKQGRAYLLYSIGSDGKDDGGKPIDKAQGSTTSNRHLMTIDSTGDYVAGVNR